MAMAWMLVSRGDQERILLCGDGKVLESLLLSLSLVGYFRTSRIIGVEGDCGAVPPKFTVNILAPSKQDAALLAPFDDASRRWVTLVLGLGFRLLECLPRDLGVLAPLPMPRNIAGPATPRSLTM